MDAKSLKYYVVVAVISFSYIEVAGLLAGESSVGNAYTSGYTGPDAQNEQQKAQLETAEEWTGSEIESTKENQVPGTSQTESLSGHAADAAQEGQINTELNAQAGRETNIKLDEDTCENTEP